MNARHSHTRIGAVTLLRATVLVSLLTSIAALPPGRYVGIEQGTTGLHLELPGIEDAVYDVHAKSNLADTAWQPIGAVTGVVGVTTYPLNPINNDAQFLRVKFPQPTVSAGEPALYAHGTGGSYLYVTGAFFYPGDQIWVQGVLLSNVVFLSSILLRADLPPGLPPGRYDVQVVDGHGGATLATLPAGLEVTDPATDPNRLLYEPPQWPPAAPSASGRRGYGVTPALSNDSEADSFTRISEIKREIETMEWKEGMGRGHVTVLKAHAGGGGGEDCDDFSASLAGNGHVTVLKAHADGPDDDCDGVAARLSGNGHVTVLKGRDDDCDGEADLRLHSGELYLQATDLTLPGRGLDFTWTRTYRSRTGESTSQGSRWSHSYDVRCVVTPGEGSAWVHDGTGRKDQYVRQPDGTYTCPGFFREGTLTGGVFRLTFADTGFWEFLPQDGTATAGKLARIQDRNGNALTLGYDGSGRLAQITDTLARVHTVAYTTEGLLASITDSTGRTVTYAHYGSGGGGSGGSAGDLMSATSPPVTGTPNGNDFPDGKTVTYAYTAGQPDPRGNGLLVSVVDALGQTAVQCTYDLDPASFSAWRAISLQHGASPPACVTYLPQTPSPDNRFGTMRCIVNDPVGNVSESLFDARNRCLGVRNFTGRAVVGVPVTDSVNRPTGKLRATDPDLFESQLGWNRDSLCTRIALPNGQVGRFEYAGDADVLTRSRKRPDLLTAEWDSVIDESLPIGADTDGDGMADLFALTRHYTYDPRFGSDPTAANMRSRVNNLESRLMALGLLARTTGDKTPIVKGSGLLCGDTDHFRVSATDPNGTVATAAYNAHGNLIYYQCGTDPRGGIGTAAPNASFAYDAHGQLTSITNALDAAGRRRVDALTWSQGRVVLTVTDADGDTGSDALAITTAYEYDNRGNLTRVVDPRSNDVLIAYNVLGQPVTVAKQTQGATFGERVKTAFHYDANDNLVRVDHDNRDATGAFDPLNPQWSTVFEYDTQNRQTRVLHERVHGSPQNVMTNEFVHDANGRVTLHRLPEAVNGNDTHNAIAYAHDERGLLLRTERAPGTGLSTVDTFDYDGNGNLRKVSKVDAFTIKQSLFDYDGLGRRVRVTDALGNVATRCFDADGNLTYERADGETLDVPGGAGNRKLAESRYRYDTLNRRVARIDSFFDIFTEAPLGDGKSDTAWSYAPNGQLVSVTDDNGAASTFSYDRVGRLASVTDPKGNATAFAYDPNGNVLTTTQSDRSDVSAGLQVFVRTFAYDTLNRLVSASDNVGNTVTAEYDSCGNAVSVTDPLGNETVRTYDGLGRVRGDTSFAGEKERGITINTSHVEYGNNRVVSATDGNGNTTVYAYDACDRLSGVTRADNTSESLVWSPRSNLELRTDANGTTITNTYDLRDRLVRRDVAVPEGVMPTTTFESFAYDGLGHLVLAENDVSSLAFAYDSLDHCVASSQDGQVATATFDGEGNRLSMTYPSGLSVLTAHDPLNRPATVSTLASAGGSTPIELATFAYDGADRLARVTRSNGINTRLFWNGQQGTPNAAGDFGWQQVSRVNHALAGGGQVVDQRLSAYDRNQNKILRAMTAAWTSGGPLVTNRFVYDGADRLTHSRKDGDLVPADFVYVLDANGNRLQVTNNGIVESYTLDATLPEPADAQVNQYTQTPFGTQTHDANGNRVVHAGADATTVYHFDYSDRLVQVDALDPVGVPTPVATYGYDALGRRIGKTVFAAGGLPPVTTTYVYGVGPAGELIETHENGALKRTKVSPHVFEIRGSIRGTPYTFDTTMFLTATITDAGDTFFFHMDELGNTLALTDASGAVVERCGYGDFGVPSFFDAAGTPLAQSSVENRHLFHGMLWEPETGLYHGSDNPLYEDQGTGGSNPLHGSTRSVNMCVDPQIGQTLSRRDGPPAAGQNDHSFADNNPWSLKKEEGGRHTPFHNKYRASRTTDVTGEIELVSGRSISSVLKTRHDTAKNSVGNIR